MAGPEVMLIMTVASTAFEVIGGFQAASAAEAQAQQQQQIYEMQAQQAKDVAERNALIAKDQAAYDAEQFAIQINEEQALAQRQFINERRRTRITQSNLTNVVGASGGGVADPTVIDIVGDLAGEGDYAANVAMYQGNSAEALLKAQTALRLYEGEQIAQQELYQGKTNADMLTYQGQSAVYQGKIQAQQARIGAIGAGLKGAANAYSLNAKYAPSSYTTGGTYSSPSTNYGGQSVGTYQKPYGT